MKPFVNNPFPKMSNQSEEAQMSEMEQQQLLQIIQSNPQLLQKYNAQLQKQGKKVPSFQKPMTNEEYLAKSTEIDKYLDEEGGLVILPESAYVIKFLHKRTNEKIFINIVKHHVVDYPQEKVLVDFDNQSGLRIPMSMGKMRDQTDNSGNPCKAVDVVFNPKIIQTADQNEDIMTFMIQIVANYLLEKYKIQIAEQKWKKVKGLKYKGGSNVEIQRVKGKKSPKIQQLSENKKSQQQISKEQELFNELNNPTNKAIKPQFHIYAYIDNHKQPYSLDTDLRKISKLQIVFDLPHLIHSRGIHLEASNKFIYLSVKSIYQICLRMPISVGKWVAKFGKKQRQLSVDVYTEDNNNKQLDENVQIKKETKKVDIEMQSDLLYDIV